MEEFFRNGISYHTEPSLRQKTREVGISFDDFIDGLKNNKSNLEIASELGISDKIISHLRNHFEQHGLGATIGHD